MVAPAAAQAAAGCAVVRPARGREEEDSGRRGGRGGEKAPAGQPAEEPEKEAEKPAPEIKAALEPEPAEQWVTLGSADDDETKNPYRMLVTLSNKGAALARIELSSPHYCDIDDRSGYLGHVVMSAADRNDGCLVQVVGPGTPAAEAGLKPGDVIKSVNGSPVTGRKSLEDVLSKTKPRQTAELVVIREGKEVKLSAKLRRRPLQVIRPEEDDPLSMLLYLAAVRQREARRRTQEGDG